MENERNINRFWTLRLTGNPPRLEPVVDAEEWFHGCSRTWARYGETSFRTMSALDRFIVLRGIYDQGDFADRTRRQVLRYYDECKVLLGDLTVGDTMYDTFWQVTNDVFNTIYVSLFIGIGVSKPVEYMWSPEHFGNEMQMRTRFDLGGYVWSPEYFGDEMDKKRIDMRALRTLLLCVYKRYTHVKGFTDLVRSDIADYAKIGPTIKRKVYRNGLDLGETPGSMICTKFDVDLLKEVDIR